MLAILQNLKMREDWINANWLKSMTLLGFGREEFKEKTLDPMINFDPRNLSDRQYETLESIAT